MTQAGPADDPAAIEKHSVLLRGHRTSISLERIFWQGLIAAAAAEGLTVNALAARIDEARTGNLSSAIRVFLMQRLSGTSSDQGA